MFCLPLFLLGVKILVVFYSYVQVAMVPFIPLSQLHFQCREMLPPSPLAKLSVLFRVDRSPWHMAVVINLNRISLFCPLGVSLLTTIWERGGAVQPKLQGVCS